MVLQIVVAIEFHPKNKEFSSELSDQEAQKSSLHTVACNADTVSRPRYYTSQTSEQPYDGAMEASATFTLKKERVEGIHDA